jgi:hypothetical protein
VGRAKTEPPGVRLAMLRIWKMLVGRSKSGIHALERMWMDADLDPSAEVAPEDYINAEAAVEEALASCRICVVDLATFLKLVRRVTLAAKPNGELILAVEVEYAGRVAFIATKASQWIRSSGGEVDYIMPFSFRENLRQLGLELDANPEDVYLELSSLAEPYETVADAYLKPILLQAAEKLKVSPFLARCTQDERIIYVAAELLRAHAWYFDSKVGLGRNSLYEALRRRGLLASSTTVPVQLYDEFGTKVKKRALAFYIDKLSEFIEMDVSQICRSAAEMEEVEEHE